MKAQFVKTFIKAAAFVALATSIANCGAMPEESITESTYQPTSENTDKTTNNDDEEETTNKTPSRSTEPIVDGCEAFGLVYDAANNTCVDDEYETNIIAEPDNPTIIVETCEGMGLVDDGNGVCTEPAIPVYEDFWMCLDQAYLECGVNQVRVTDEMNFTVNGHYLEVRSSWDLVPGATKYWFIRSNNSNMGGIGFEIFEDGTDEFDYEFKITSGYYYRMVAELGDGSKIASPIVGPVATHSDRNRD